MHAITRALAVRQIEKHTSLADAAEREGRADIARRHRRWVESWRDALAFVA